MQPFTTQHLNQPLTILMAERQADGEGGYKEIWRPGARVWGGVIPCISAAGKPLYRVVVRAVCEVGDAPSFIWHLRGGGKRLWGKGTPQLIQDNQFLLTLTEENPDA